MPPFAAPGLWYAAPTYGAPPGQAAHLGRSTPLPCGQGSLLHEATTHGYWPLHTHALLALPISSISSTLKLESIHPHSGVIS